MSKAPLYRKVDPRLWDDDKFIDLPDDAQLLWLMLITGPQVSIVPGIIVGGVGTLAEVFRKGYARTEAALAEIVKAGMAEVDDRRRVIRVTRAPFYNPPESPNVVRGWFKLWRTAPESPLKYRHVASLKAAVDFGMKGMHEAWDSTFGTLPPALPEGLPEPFPKGSMTPLATVPQTLREPGTGTGTQQEQEQEQEGSPAQAREAPGPLAALPRGAQGQDADGPHAQLDVVEACKPIGELIPPEADPDRLTPERFVALWNDATGGQIRKLESARRDAIRKAIARQPDPEFWQRCFAKAAEQQRVPDTGWLDLAWVLGAKKGSPNAERLESGGFDWRLGQAGRQRDVRTGSYRAEDAATDAFTGRGDITHEF